MNDLSLTQVQDDELALEQTLRPQLLSDYVGQTTIKENLSIAIAAAKKRGEALDHVLIHGAPGLGKTTLAQILARELRTNLKTSSGPALSRTGDLAAILTNLEDGDIFFIDEIHRLPRAVEEVLYAAMEDFALDLLIGKGPAARSVRLDLKPFTLVGATTKIGALAAPLRDRFGIAYGLNFYEVSEIAAIIDRSARILGITIDQPAIEAIAARARRTPRIANRLLKRIRDYADIEGDGRITLALSEATLERLQIDRLGLDQTDRRLLTFIAHQFRGGPVGIEALAAATAEDRETLEIVYEPYLMSLGFLERTPKGRVITPAALTHLGLELGQDRPQGKLL